MDGVTILNQYTTFDMPIWVIPVIVVLIICSISSVVLGSIAMDNCNTNVGFALLTICITIIVGIIALPIVFHTESYEYEAIIDEDVSFTELNERYEIIDQRGEIYILRDKEIQE